MYERLERKANEGNVAEFVSAEDVVVPNGVNWIIDDVGMDSEQRALMQEFLRVRVEFLNPSLLSDSLGKLIQRELPFMPGGTSIIYPKNGGLAVQSTIKKADFVLFSTPVEEFPVDAIRTRVNTPPSITLPPALVAKLKESFYNNIVVMDDVLVTGQTVKQIQQAIYEETDIVNDSDYVQGLRFDWSNIKTKRLRLNWYVASWLRAERPRAQNETLSNIKKVLSVIAYKGNSGQPPVNSMSTWLYDKIKGEQVLARYADKYAISPEKFVSFVESMKGEIKPCR